jgi:iron complex outermembrane receptor protein
LHKKQAETVHPVNVLAGEDLSLKQATTIGETLKGELGIHSMSFGSSVGQPVIRGQSGVGGRNYNRF